MRPIPPHHPPRRLPSSGGTGFQPVSPRDHPPRRLPSSGGTGFQPVSPRDHPRPPGCHARAKHGRAHQPHRSHPPHPQQAHQPHGQADHPLAHHPILQADPCYPRASTPRLHNHPGAPWTKWTTWTLWTAIFGFRVHPVHAVHLVHFSAPFGARATRAARDPGGSRPRPAMIFFPLPIMAGFLITCFFAASICPNTAYNKKRERPAPAAHPRARLHDA